MVSCYLPKEFKALIAKQINKGFNQNKNAHKSLNCGSIAPKIKPARNVDSTDIYVKQHCFMVNSFK